VPAAVAVCEASGRARTSARPITASDLAATLRVMLKLVISESLPLGSPLTGHESYAGTLSPTGSWLNQQNPASVRSMRSDEHRRSLQGVSPYSTHDANKPDIVGEELAIDNRSLQ
jgi:hypothetical protein